MDTMFELLLQLPLFKGVSYEKLSQVITKTRFHFLKYPAGETIVRQDEECTHIKFIISGSVRLETVNDDGRFAVRQMLHAPDVMAPQALFGRNRFYPFTATAAKPTGLLQISKDDYVTIINSDVVFLYNYLNILSISSQKAIAGVLALTHGSLEERLAYWVLTLTQPGATGIKMQCRLRDLYGIFGVQRSTFVATLEQMKAEGLLDYSTSEVSFTDRQRLVELLAHRHKE